MIHQEKLFVKEAEAKDGRCEFDECLQPLGQEHAKGCVLRCRTVVVTFGGHYPIIVEVPADASPEEQKRIIQHYLNEDSFGTQSDISILDQLKTMSFEICEATDEDERKFVWEIPDE